MKNVTLDLTNIQTPRGAQVYIGYAMNFPAHYGRNLDALSDMLGEIAEPTLLTLCRPAVLPVQMAAYFPRLALVLHDAQEENENLQVLVEII